MPKGRPKLSRGATPTSSSPPASTKKRKGATPTAASSSSSSSSSRAAPKGKSKATTTTKKKSPVVAHAQQPQAHPQAQAQLAGQKKQRLETKLNRACRNNVVRTNDAVARNVFAEEHVGRDVAALIMGVRSLIVSVFPDAVETLWHAPKRSANVGQSPSKPKHFCVICPNRSWVTLGFNVTHGLAAKDSFGLLVGKGKDWRRVRLESLADLKKPGLSELIRAAGELIYAPATTSTSKRKNGDDNGDDNDNDNDDDDHDDDDDAEDGTVDE